MIEFFLSNKNVKLTSKINGNPLYEFVAADGLENIPIDRVYFSTPCQVVEIKEILKDCPANPIMVFDQKDILPLKEFPKNIGFSTFKEIKKQFEGKKELKIAIVNGFSHSIGDHLIGMTAFDYWTDHIEKALGMKVKVTFFQLTAYYLQDITTRFMNKIHEVYQLPVPLTDLVKSDAYIDLCTLTTEPYFDEVPMIDFYFRALSIDPATVPVFRKRNKYTLDNVKLAKIHERITQYNKNRRPVLFFQHTSSNPIRTLPTEKAVKIVNEIISKSEYFVVGLGDLNIESNRFVNLTTMSKSLDDYAHLICSADALITVDTCSYHFGDVYNIPTVVLFSTIEPDLRIRYYPYVKGIMLEEKGGKLYGRHNSFEQEDIDYVNTLWDKISVDEILALLR